MTEFKKYDQVSIMKEMYHEKMYIVKEIHKLLYPFEAFNTNKDIYNSGLANFKCALCRNCILKEDPEDGYYMFCKVKKKNMYVIKPEKMIDCECLIFQYSDLIAILKNHNISLDKILREYKGT